MIWGGAEVIFNISKTELGQLSQIRAISYIISSMNDENNLIHFFLLFQAFLWLSREGKTFYEDISLQSCNGEKVQS